MNGKLLFLSQEDVLRTNVCTPLPMNTLMRAVFTEIAAGRAVVPDKAVLRWGDLASESTQGRVNIMPASVCAPRPGLGVKWIASFPGNRTNGLPRATSVIVLSDTKTGVPICIVEGSIISAARTAAVNSLAAEYLCPSEPESIGMIGAGVQNRFQLEHFQSRYPSIRRVCVYNRTRERAERILADKRFAGLEMRVASTPSEVAAVSQIVIVGTTSPVPVIEETEVPNGATWFQFSSDELGDSVVRQFDRLYYDDWNAILHRGNLSCAKAAKRGTLDAQVLSGSLAELVAGGRKGRKADERILFAAIGIAAEDIAVASEVYGRALDMGIGVRLQLWQQLDTRLVD